MKTTFHIQRTILVILTIVRGALFASEPDALQLRLLRDHDLPLRWENVEHSPYWKGGKKTHWSFKNRLHTVRLGHGEQSWIHLPAWTTLRISGVETDLKPDDVAVSISNGTGLLVRIPLLRSGDGKSLFLLSNSPDPGMVSIESNTGREIELALFVSRTEPLPDLAPYRRTIPIDGSSVRIRSSNQATGERFWSLDREVSETVTGPLRIALETRFRYSNSTGQAGQEVLMDAKLEGAPFQTVILKTGFNNRSRMYVNRKLATLSGLERAFLDIPAGDHVLSLSSHQPLFVRLLALEEPDYLLPRWNGPRTKLEDLRQAGALSGVTPQTWEEAQRAIVQPIPDEATMTQIALALSASSSVSEGALLGFQILKTVADLRPDAPELREQATAFFERHTFYRDMLPASDAPDSRDRIRFGYFIPRTLRNLGSGAGEVVVSEPLMISHIASLPSALFVPVPETGGRIGLEYTLPESAVPSVLRIMIARGSSTNPTTLLLHMDRGTPQRLVVMPHDDRPLDEFRMPVALAALDALAWRHGELDAGTWGGPFQRRFQEGPLLDVAYAEIPLPAHVRRIRIVPEGNHEGRLDLAMQRRVSKRHSLSEAGYRSALRQQNAQSQDLLLHLIGVNRNASAEDGPHSSGLAAFLNPLLRQLNATVNRFVGKLESPTAEPPFRNRTASAPQDTIARAAKEALEAGRFDTAFDRYRKLETADPKHAPPDAILGQAEALRGLGETFLASLTLSGAYLWDPNPAVQRRAFARLTELANEREDAASAEDLFAVDVVRTGNPESARSLVELFVLRGKMDFALQLGLMLPVEHQPREALLEAALAEGWWQTFDELLEGVPEPKRLTWLGSKELESERVETALQLFERAGSEGELKLRQLQDEIALRRALGGNQQRPSTQVLKNWEEWQATKLQSGFWREDLSLATGYPAVASVHSLELDLYSNYLHASPMKPLHIEVRGPTRLQFRVRPLHSGETTDAIDDWLLLRDEWAERRVPVLANRASESLEIVGDHEQRPGTGIETELILGPGKHVFDVAPEKHTALVQVRRMVPKELTGVMPILTQDTWDLVNAGLLPPAIGNGDGVFSNPDKKYLLLDRGAAPPAHVLLPPEPAHQPGSWPISAQTNPFEPTVPSFDSTETTTPQSDDAVELLAEWMSRAEAATDPVERERALVEGEMHALNHAPVPGVQALKTRLTGSRSWKALDAVENSAGFRWLETEGWTPASPGLRIRAALAEPPMRPQSLVLYGSRKLSIGFHNLEPTSVEATFSAHVVRFTPRQPLVVAWCLDQGPETQISLEAGMPEQSLKISVPIGDHEFEAWLMDPPANHFVGVDLEEFPSVPAELREGDQALSETMPQRRYYQIATREEPLRLRVNGPALLRVHRIEEDIEQTSYQSVTNGWHVVEFMPEGTSEEALFQIFQRVSTDEAPEASVPEETQTPFIPPAIPLTLPPLLPVTGVAIQDELRLGRQEDGTWSLAGSLVQRREFESVQEQRKERFLQLDATHRYRSPTSGVYYETTALGRAREVGGPSFGLGEVMHGSLPRSTWNLQVEATGYFQRSGDTAASNSDEIEWALGLRPTLTQQRTLNPKTHHTIAVGAHARALSLSDTSAYPAGTVDQDVFSSFKADHRWGLALSDRLAHSPWRDTEGWVRAAAMSNENLTLDNLGASLGWNQLFGPVQAGIAYQFRHFLSDQDRRQSANRQAVLADISWMHWSSSRARWEVGTHYRYDFTPGEHTALLSLTWHWGEGRGLHDFRPSLTRFQNLRPQEMPPNPNNSFFQTRDE